SREAVDAFVAAAESAGAEILHQPRLRPEYHPAYYGGFVRDPDGNNVEAGCHTGAEGGGMAGLTADLFVLLDGHAAGENVGPFFGYGGPELDERVGEVLDQPHVIVMGRNTYQILAEMSIAASDGVSGRMNELPKVVVSNTLSEPLEWPNTRLIRGDLGAEMKALKETSPVPLRAIGSITLVSNMIRLGLGDVLRLTIFPLTLGSDGREPLFAGFPRGHYELATSRVLDSRLV